MPVSNERVDHALVTVLVSMRVSNERVDYALVTVLVFMPVSNERQVCCNRSACES